jgi:hypothetical protein
MLRIQLTEVRQFSANIIGVGMKPAVVWDPEVNLLADGDESDGYYHVEGHVGRIL